MEKGHSLMETNSMHSTIEYAQRCVPVYIMRDWLNVFLMARSNRNKNKRSSSFIVKELKFDEFVELKVLSQVLIKNKKCDSEGQNAEWLRIITQANTKNLMSIPEVVED
ncbi:hypothetical protein ANN_24517 [Periplaneta americana]|uniref:Uncharacterized protein n=1 Tax=Periplaneta americana TaxID=6978 RepID=A0ABQ8S3Q5_PERAM|nr:hypothetical protein ANN_24517 [Periplaneta americana]